ncbi:MAG: GAP family protein [Thermoleophilaceae bacterium]|nr:GAP family protein [Thermoleophilaceae bacterium]
MHLQILPLAVTMMAGPQIMVSVLLLTGKNPVRPSIAYAAAVGICAAIGVFVATVVAGVLHASVPMNDSGQPTTEALVIQIVLVLLLIFAAMKQYLGRATSEAPKWLESVQTAEVGQVVKFAAMLIFMMPTDIIAMLTVGINLESNSLAFVDALPFIGLTALIAALPLIAYLALGKRARAAMPATGEWMTANSWAVNVFVCVLFIFLILG